MAFLQSFGSAANKSSSAFVSFNTTAVIPANTLLVLGICMDNASATTPIISSITAVGGGTWTPQAGSVSSSGATATAGTGVFVYCQTLFTTTQVASGTAIYVYFNSVAVTSKSAMLWGFSDMTNTPRGTPASAASTTGVPSIATAGTALVAGDVVIGVAGAENSAAMVGDTDTLNGSWSTISSINSTGSSAATNTTINMQYKQVTASGVQTFNPTGGVADSVAIVFSFVPTPFANRADSVGVTDSFTFDHISAVPKISTLTDDFATDLSKWPGTYGAVVLQSGQVKITSADSYPALWTSPNTYDLTDSAAFCKMTMPTDAGGNGREMVFEIRTPDNVNKVYWYCTGLNLLAAFKNSGGITNLRSLAYDPVAMQWLKIAHSSGTVVWSTSPDGTNWTEFINSSSIGFTPNNCEVVFTAGWYLPDSAWDTYIDNFNVAPAGTALTADVADVVGITDAVETSKVLVLNLADDVFTLRDGGSHNILDIESSFETDTNSDGLADGWRVGTEPPFQAPSSYSIVPPITNGHGSSAQSISLVTPHATLRSGIVGPRIRAVVGQQFGMYLRVYNPGASTVNISVGWAAYDSADVFKSLTAIASTAILAGEAKIVGLTVSDMTTNAYYLRPTVSIAANSSGTIHFDSVAMYDSSASSPPAYDYFDPTKRITLISAPQTLDRSDAVGVTDSVQPVLTPGGQTLTANLVDLVWGGGQIPESFTSYPIQEWTEGQVYGAYRAVFNSNGPHGIVDDVGNRLVRQQPEFVSGDTRASLSVSTASYRDVDVTMRMKTVSQNRPTDPNAWERAWAVAAYVDNDWFYYVVLKTNGLEVGKRDPAYPGGQRFLPWYQPTNWPLGSWNKVRIKLTEVATGTKIQIWVDDVLQTSYWNDTQNDYWVDEERPLNLGAIGFYNEDALVHFDDVAIVGTGTVDTATTGVGKALIDIVTITDSVGVSKVGATGLSDTETLADTISATGSFVRSYLDPLGVTDSIATTKSSPGNFADLESLTDSVGTTAIYIRGYSDTENLTDSVSTSKALINALADIENLTDYISRQMARGYLDTEALTDYFIKGFGKSLSEPVGLTDSITTAQTSQSGRPKVYTGTVFTPKPGKVWNGAAWAEKPWKRWDGSSWKTLT